MNWEAIGALGEIGGAVVVIATLVYLARQIRQSNQIAIASTEFHTRNCFNQFVDLVATDTGLAELLVKAADEKSEMSSAETVKLYHIVIRSLNQWLAVETAYSNGVVPAETHELIYDDMRTFLYTYPRVRTLCRQAIDNYPAMAPSRVFTHMSGLLADYNL